MNGLETRLAVLERRSRAQRVALVVVTVAVLASPLRAAVEQYAAGWLLHRDGRGTFGSDLHRTGATIDIVADRDRDVGLALVRPTSTDLDPSIENFMVFSHEQPDGTVQKDMSFSTHWSYAPHPNYGTDPALLTRLFTVYQGADRGHQSENIGLLQCGGFGSVFYPDNAINGAECPGLNTVAVNGPLVAKKDLYVSGRLFVNGVER